MAWNGLAYQARIGARETWRPWLLYGLRDTSYPHHMDAADVRKQLKELMVSELNLEGKAPSDIDDAGPLFGDGLGLDSLDALQLAMTIEESFGVRIPDGAEARPIFASVNAIVEYILQTMAG